MKIKTDCKLFWKHVRQNTKTNVTVNNLVKPDGTMTNSDLEKAEALNNHFVKVFTDEDTTNIPQFPSLEINSQLESINVREEETAKAIHEINPSKAQGPDNIHPPSN